MTGVDYDKLRNEQLPFLLLFLVTLLYLLPHINNFYVPASDFFDIDDKAKLLQSFSWPKDFKRPPLFPILTALLALPFSSKYAALYAAELLTFLSALGSLFFLYRIGTRLLGRWGFWPAWLWAIHPSTLMMAVKPKPDMTALFFILWAFDLFLQGKPKAFLPAFFATLFRYEGTIAIAAFFSADFFFSKEKARSFLLAVLSGAFIVLWTLLHSGSGEGAAYTDYFDGIRLNWAFIKDFAAQLLEILPIPVKLTSFPAVIAALIGLDKTRRRSPHAAVGLLAYALGFTAMHIIWPFPSRDYGVLGVWVLLLLVVAGSFHVIKKVAAYRLRLIPSTWTKLANAAVGLSAVTMIALVVYLSIRGRLYFEPLPSAAFVLTAAVFPTDSKHFSFFDTGKLLGLATALVLACFSLSLSHQTFLKIKNEKAEYRLVGEWFEKHRTAEERMAVDQPTIVSYHTSLDRKKDFVRLIDLPAVDPDSLSRWLAQEKVAYIVWFSAQRMPENPDGWMLWKMKNRGWRTVEFLKAPHMHPNYVLVDSLNSGIRWALIYRVINAPTK